MMSATHKPLSALLSQILVAYTVEIDCEFERRMLQMQSRSARLSLVIWLNLLRFLADGSVMVRALASRSLTAESGVTAVLGCLERWGVVELQPGKRAGFGSGRGIRADWPVRLTASGETAVKIWRGLLAEIDARWSKRFGDDATRLRRSLEAIEHQIDLELPQGLPTALLKLPEFGPRHSVAEEGLPLPVLLSRVLLAFAIDFERESRTPISLCANAIRALSDEPLPETEISKRTGCSKETAGIGWQHKPYIIVENDPARGRGKLVRLPEAGIKAQQKYYSCTRAIEEKWKNRFHPATKEIRELLAALLKRGDLSEGLKPTPGTTRAGSQSPALGRVDIGPAARQRRRDLVIQTEAFLRDPVGTLPHYPLWDMNRGFGP
jgi:DNA-binding MarR family transcriptional regulator